MGKKLKDKERHEVKEIAKELLQRLEANQLNIGLWNEKVQIASAVRQTINNYLFERLPYPSYDENDINVKTDLLFDYFRKQYGGMVA